MTMLHDIQVKVSVDYQVDGQARTSHATEFVNDGDILAAIERATRHLFNHSLMAGFRMGTKADDA